MTVGTTPSAPPPAGALDSADADATTVRVGRRAGVLPSLALALADPAVREIVIEPGEYVEQVVIAPRAAPLLLRSSTGRAEDVRIIFGLHQGARDRTGMPYVQDCATLTIDADHVTLRDLTVANSFDKRRHAELPDTQAIALRTRGDQILVERCHLLGQQDTVLLDAPSWASVHRVHLRDCLVEGDVDFLYGRATALVEGGEIRSVGPGYLLAPSTARENPRGFLVHGARLTAADGVAPGSVRLGRPWHPGGKPDAIGQAIVSACAVGPHVATAPWSAMGGFAWEDARLAEHGNDWGGRAGGGPQLAAAPDPATWLEEPVPAPDERPRAIVLSDSTASEYGPERAPREGWGMRLGAATGLEVLNRAVSGRSSTSFLAEGRLDDALEELRAGDLVLIAFGHNDAKDDERSADVHLAYPAALRRMIVGVRARGGVPVLLTPLERRRFEDGRAVPTHSGYPQAVRALAAEEDLPLIDLSRLTLELWEADGEERSKESFLWLEPGRWPGFPDGECDDTHLSALGARRIAELVAASLRDLRLLP
jgi:lysophospholipase L1-like esterase